MTYKETLFFIGKCLTISNEEHNKIQVEVELKLAKIDWEKVVKVATSHYVFPALYCNLKRVNFLHYLPTDLVEYMKHITDLNRERNIQIIEQAKEINELLITNNITPIFLKGTGNLLEGLYDDIAERMVGDIDFLVSKENFKRTVSILKKNGYERTSKKLSSPIYQKHYPRLFNKEKTAAVEVHIKALRDNANLYFNYDSIKKNIISKNNFHFLNHKDQLVLTTLAIQHNDYGFLLKRINLRISYDILLISKKIGKNNFKFKDYKIFFNLLNSYFSVSSSILNSKIIKFKSTLFTKLYLKIIYLKIQSPIFYSFHNKLWQIIKFIILKYCGVKRFLTIKVYRDYYIKKLFS